MQNTHSHKIKINTYGKEREKYTISRDGKSQHINVNFQKINL